MTCDADEERYLSRRPYADAIERAGGVPVLLPHRVALADEYVARCDAIVLTGGDDPIMEHWGIRTHVKATPVQSSRQAFELALLAALDRRRDRAALGICLGMQYMALHAGGALDQHLPDSCPTHAVHWGRVLHRVSGDRRVCQPIRGASAPVEPSHGEPRGSESRHVEREPGERSGIVDGMVLSHHRQAVVDPGRLVVAARADDGVIEAVCDPARPFYLGVQWHPERTEDPTWGAGVLRALVGAAR